MKNRALRGWTALLVVLICALAPMAQAQVLEGLLWGALGSAANAKIAASQNKVESAVKVVFDLYLEQGDKLCYFNSWDPTTQTSVWFGDGVVLKVKAYINAGPPHDHTIYVNDQLVDWRKVEGGRWTHGQPRGAKGVVGDYPYIRISDLSEGFNQVKVRVSKTEWGSATFIRLDVRSFLDMAASEENRLKIAGAGQSTYPVVQSYTARMPDGLIRNFVSLEEMQLALAGKLDNPPPARPEQNTERPQPGGTPRGTNGRQASRVDARTEGEFEIRAGLYDQSVFNGRKSSDVRLELSQKLIGQSPLRDEDQTVDIPDGYGLAVLIMSDDKFKVQFVNPDGELIRELTVVRQAGKYASFLLLEFVRGSTPNTLVVTTESGEPRQLKFRQVEKP